MLPKRLDILLFNQIIDFLGSKEEKFSSHEEIISDLLKQGANPFVALPFFTEDLTNNDHPIHLSSLELLLVSGTPQQIALAVKHVSHDLSDVVLSNVISLRSEIKHVSQSNSGSRFIHRISKSIKTLPSSEDYSHYRLEKNSPCWILFHFFLTMKIFLRRKMIYP